MSFRTQIQSLRPIAVSEALAFNASAESAVMPEGTRQVKVASTQDAYLEFTKTGVTAATPTSMFISGDKADRYFDINAGEVIAAIKVTTAGTLYITPMGK